MIYMLQLARSQMGFSIHGLSSGKFVLDSEVLVSIGIGLVINGSLKQNNNNNDNNFKVWTVLQELCSFIFWGCVKSLLKFHPTLQANAQPDLDASLEAL